MADSKLSELTAATSVAAADTTYLVQSSTSKKVTIANLFANIATTMTVSDKFAIGDHNTLTAVGTIAADSYNVTFINNVDAGGNCSISAGIDGQIHIVIMSSNSGNHTVNLSGANVSGTISFDAAGETALLIYDTGLSKWWMIGGTATKS
tara:strand:- start:3050 stop:3499 length:450 start_codon:yes stop_codon:yes gene_type:complete